LAEISRRVAVSPVRRPSSIRAQLITAAAAPAQQIQDFGPEVGRRARRLSFNGDGFARCGLVCQ
jgi:hypothetical protein